MNQARVEQGRVEAMRKPVQRVGCREALAVREGSTGRVVPVALRRVWAVAEVGAVTESAVVDPAHDGRAVMNGAPVVAAGTGPRVARRCRALKARVEVAREEPEMALAGVSPKAELAGVSPKAELAGVSPKAELVGVSPKAELVFYRKYTEALLRRYMRMSMSAGRVPSLMGREMFRGHVTHYRAHTFEDVAIFCFDIERQLERLNAQEKELVKRIALQQYTQMEVAGMLGVTLRHTVRLYGATLDRLTRMFLVARLLESQTFAGP